MIPSLQGGHVRKLNNHYSLGLPHGILLLQDHLATRFGDVASTVLGNNGTDLDPVFLELCGVSDGVLSDDVGWHFTLARLGKIEPDLLLGHWLGEQRHAR